MLLTISNETEEKMKKNWKVFLETANIMIEFEVLFNKKDKKTF